MEKRRAAIASKKADQETDKTKLQKREREEDAEKNTGKLPIRKVSYRGLH
jgi:hypothetical protein